MIAIEAGWVVTEVGRQPWIVYNIVRTADAVTPMPGLVVRVEVEPGQRVEVGQQNGLQAEIRSGLKPGDRVILHPGTDVRDGIEVEEREQGGE